MSFDVGKFTGSIIGISVGVIMVAAVLPVIASVTIPEGMANGAAIESMFSVLPIILVAGVVMGGVYLFISRR